MDNKPLQLFDRVRRSIWMLPLAAVGALLLFGINETAYNRSTQELESLGKRGEARTQIQALWRSLTDAETGQRGYLLTGRKHYLEPYQRAVGTVQESLQWLALYYQGDAEAVPLLAEVSQQSASKLSELSTTLQLFDEGRRDAWHEFLLTDIGREKMEAVRNASRLLLNLESSRVAAERAEIFATMRYARLGVNAMLVLSLVALFMFLRQTRVLERSQSDHAAALRAERDRLETEVSLRTADLTELARHLQTAREDEKSHLARELHDELGALLTAAKLDAARLKRAIGPISVDVEARLKHLNETINRGIELKRRIIEELRPSSLNNLGLAAALEILVRDFAARSDTRVSMKLDSVELDDGAQITAYRLVQEALTNAAKYAGASEISVTLEAMPSGSHGYDVPGARIAVRDNGRGFDPLARLGTSHGLIGMRYRVEGQGGKLQLQSAPGAGTLVEAWMPQATTETPAVV